MTTIPLAEARRNLDAVLDEASRKGVVEVRGDDGRTFLIRPATATRSSLDVPGVQSDLTAAEIVAAVRDVRERG